LAAEFAADKSSMGILGRVILIVLALISASCSDDSAIRGFLGSPNATLPSVEAPNLTASKTKFYSGESILLSSLFTDTNFTFTSPDGYYDVGTQSLVIPKNLPSRTFTFEVRNAGGGLQAFTFDLLGLDEYFEVPTPQTYGDQNYPTASAVLPTGELFVSTINIDSAGGWEWGVVFRSIDSGVSWQTVDYYYPYNNGESHILAMDSRGSNIYYCGYEWDSDNYDAIHWYVRRSLDKGATWQTSFKDTTLNVESSCQSLAVSPTTGFVYVGGYDMNGAGNGRRWVIRESQNNGATWTEVYTRDVPNNWANTILHMEVSPNDTIWFLAPDIGGVQLFKGSFSLGSWNFSAVGPAVGASASTQQYQIYGELELVDDNTAFLSSQFDLTWTVKRTTDGGNTWSTVFDNGANSAAASMEVLSNGDIVAMGWHFPGGQNRTVRRARSTDGGDTWGVVDAYTEARNNRGGLVFEDMNNDVHAVDVSYSVGRHFVSTDFGASWTEFDYITYREKFYNYLRHMIVTASGSLLSVGLLGSYDPQTEAEPWYVNRSANGGTSWSDVEINVTPGVDQLSRKLAQDSLGNIFVLGSAGSDIKVRRSSNDGVTWAEVESYTHPQLTSWNWNDARVVVDAGNNIYYSTKHHVGGTQHFADIRKGTPGGAVWSTVATFPVTPGHTNFFLSDLTVDRNDDLWVAGQETNTLAQQQTVIFKSADGGTTWTEVYRQASASGGTFNEIFFATDGDIFAIQAGNRVLKSIDGGATWTEILSAATPPDGGILTSTGHLVVYSGTKLLKYSEAQSSWITISDQVKTMNPVGRGYIDESYTDINFLIELSPTSLGLMMSFGEQGDGIINFMKRIPLAP